jgi:hypothetical protein
MHSHPGFAYWWRRGRFGHGGPGACAEEAHAGPPGEGEHHGRERGHDHHDHHRDHRHGPPWAHFVPGFDDDFGGGSFGVRRPLRFLAHKLDLNDEQVAELARVLDDLKTERAQGAVDQRRTTATFADAVAGDLAI